MQRGDRLLSINQIDLSNKTLNQVVDLLRNLPTGSWVDIVVSRQDLNNNVSFTSQSVNLLNSFVKSKLDQEPELQVEDYDLGANANSRRFLRDAPHRRSISEKRTKIVGKTGNRLALRSQESVAALNSDKENKGVDVNETLDYSMLNSIRSRTINRSFRQAVDKSFGIS
jgi:hypothetical protein